MPGVGASYGTLTHTSGGSGGEAPRSPTPLSGLSEYFRWVP